MTQTHSAARQLGLDHGHMNRIVRHSRGERSDGAACESLLHAAHRIHETEGYRLVREEAHHNFGADLVGPDRELEL